MAPLITPYEKEEDKIQIRVRVKKSLLDEVDRYCQWAGINRREFFINKSIEYVLKKDKEWLQHQLTSEVDKTED